MKKNFYIHNEHKCKFRFSLSRAVASLCLAVSLTGCVTTQGSPSFQEGGFNALKPFGVNLTDVTDMFSPQVRELKSLVSASKLDEAEQYFLDNADYFEKRASSGGLLPNELSILTTHIWTTRYETKFQVGLQNIKSVETVPPPAEWPSLTKSLNEVSSLAAIIEKHRLLVLTSMGQSQAKELRQQYKRVVNLAVSKKDTVIASLITSTLQSGEHPGYYIENIKIDNSDFKRFDAFQSAALAQIKQYDTPKGVDSQAKRFVNYLTQSTKNEVDKHYVQLVHKELLADGRITIEEIATLGKFKTPFETAGASLKSIARVGYLDLTGASFKNRNIFDFEISFTKDVEIDFVPATEATFSTANLEGYDFIFVTDLTAAKVAREFKSKEEVKSSFKSGTRQAPNPNYVTAMTQYQRAMVEFQRVEISSSMPKACQGWACALQGLADGLASAGARNKVDEASKNLANTPQNLSIDVFSEYKYQSVNISSTKSSTVNYYVIDVKGKRILKNDFIVNDNERFTVAYNVHDNEKESSAIFRRFKTENEVTDWEKKPINVSLSSLFGAEGLKSASVEPFKGVEAFLKTLNTRTFASASPQYTQASKMSSTIRSSSSSSSETIADERFDSILIVSTAKATGTGFYVSPDLILTAYHVVDGSSLVELTFYDGTKTYGRVVDHDIRLDLALIRPQTTGKPLKIHSGPLRLGETVEAIGHPKGYEFTITRGVISSVRKQRSSTISSSNLVEFVQTDTPISPGNSGGPLLLKDSVIGVNDWIRVDKGSQNLNFSVSYNEIRNYLERFKGK